MPSGGARARSGPVADINSYRQRKNADGWVDLPESVDRRRTPNWPIHPAPTDRERELWRKLWRQGQSIMWEAQKQAFEVAMYVRLAVEVEVTVDVPTARLTQRRIMADALGLTIDGLLRRKWKFADPVRPEPKQVAPDGEKQRKSSAERIAELFGTASDDGEA